MSRPANKVLVIDDEPDIRELLAITLRRMKVEPVCAASLAEGEEALRDGAVRFCLTDMRLPDGDGLDMLERLQCSRPELPVAVITAHGNVETAIRALKSGAFDFLSKPVDLEQLRALINNGLELSAAPRESNGGLLGDSALMVQLRATAAKLARSMAPLYIHGESGTGKELAARLLHRLGPRAKGPFVPVNCGAIPTELLESELFGHKRGSFTGAVRDHPGLFRMAEGGTLLLDEVAELPLQMQVKLLRVIQERSVRPVGGREELPVDVRLLSATHHALDELVARGEFRSDLYYRINVISLRMPPLREHGEDIPLLAEHFLRRLAGKQGVSRRRMFSLDEEVLEALRDYAFPGNVRELENILERVWTLCEGRRITVADLGLPDASAPALEQASEPIPETEGKGNLGSYLDEVERTRILKALERAHWNKTRAARLLGVSARALRYRLKKLGIQ